MISAEPKTGGFNVVFESDCGLQRAFNLTRGGTNCSKPPFLCVGMVCRGYEYSTLFVRSIISRSGSARDPLYLL